MNDMNVRVICNFAACALRFGFDVLTFRGWVDVSLTPRAHAVGCLHAMWVYLTPPPSTDHFLEGAQIQTAAGRRPLKPKTF